MRVTLSDDARRRIALFEDITDTTAKDCLIYDDETTGSRLVFLVAAGEMGQAIGPDGRTVREVSTKLGTDVALVEDAPTPEGFVASALAPAAVYNVTISENETTIAYAEVDPADTGIAIGKNGRTIDTARALAERHFEIDDIQLV